MKALITFTEPCLGTLSGDKKLAEDYILAKHPGGISKEEQEAQQNVEEVTEKASTIFARAANGLPMLWDYHIKGFFKEACEAMINTETMTKEELKKFRLTAYLYKKTIDKQVFVTPRQIHLVTPGDCDPANLPFTERPLRGQTMRGERIALARSETVPEGTKIQIETICMNKKLEDFIKRWLTYGALSGLGQWRNSGMGRFSWEELIS